MYNINDLPFYLVGSAFIDLSVIQDYKILEAMHSKVENPTKGTVVMGGLFKPNACKAKRKVRILRSWNEPKLQPSLKCVG